MRINLHELQNAACAGMFSFTGRDDDPVIAGTETKVKNAKWCIRTYIKSSIHCGIKLKWDRTATAFASWAAKPSCENFEFWCVAPSPTQTVQSSPWGASFVIWYIQTQAIGIRNSHIQLLCNKTISALSFFFAINVFACQVVVFTSFFLFPWLYDSNPNKIWWVLLIFSVPSWLPQGPTSSFIYS